MRVDEDIALVPHDWEEITANGFGSRHDPTGAWLYGYEMCVDPRVRGVRIGQRLYDARKTLAERLELKGIIIGGRMPGYHRNRRKVDGPEGYLEAVTKIGRASCRERVCQYVKISVVDGPLKKKQKINRIKQ